VIIHRYYRQVIIPLMIICASVFLLMLAQRLSSLSVWDDAYMFVRYADNFLNYGNLAWNPNAESTYGLTSLAYLLIVLPFRMIFSSEPALVMIMSSLVSGLLAGLSMMWLLRKQVTDGIHQRIVLIILLLSIVVPSENITVHMTTGMDTMFSILVLTIWLGLLYQSDNYGLMGVLGGLFFVVRPDLLICAFGIIPALLFNGSSHSQFVKYSVGMGITSLLQLVFTHYYFGNPFPLPFYVKNIAIYSEQFYGYYTNTSSGYFIEFFLSYPYLIGIVIIGFATQFKSWSWQDRGLLLGGIGFCIYHVIFVIPIMGFSQRFFYPLVPILIVLMSRRLPPLLDYVPKSIVATLKTYPIPVLFVPLLLIFTFINPMPIILTLVQYTQPDSTSMLGMGRFDLQTTYDYLYINNWYGLDELSKLDDDIVIATTEIGLPGVMNPKKKIIDLAGLNHPDFALNGFSADWLLAYDNQPDWIYMPFPHYEGLWFAIFDHPAFRSNYQFFEAQLLGTSMDVAIRQDSKFYPIMIELFNDL
jgi:hypothetical protein